LHNAEDGGGVRRADEREQGLHESLCRLPVGGRRPLDRHGLGELRPALGQSDCPCFHSDPKFADLEPGPQSRLHGWLSFYEGPDIQAEFARIEALGWWRDGKAAL
jgi:hypothetical protein